MLSPHFIATGYVKRRPFGRRFVFPPIGADYFRYSIFRRSRERPSTSNR